MRTYRVFLFNGLRAAGTKLTASILKPPPSTPDGSSVNDSLDNIPVPYVISSNMRTLFSFFVVSHVIGPSSGAPIEDWRPPLDNLTVLQETIAPPWVSSPSTRGTFEILYSCSFTLALCVYTAIHLNVPPRKENKLSFYLRKAKWVVIALFGPEVVLYAAWDQWDQATVFCRRFNEGRSWGMEGRTTSPSSPEPPKSDSAVQVLGNDEPKSRLAGISKDNVRVSARTRTSG